MAGKAFLAIANLEIIQEIDRTLARLGWLVAGKLQDYSDVVGGVEKRQQIVRLEDEPDLVQPQAPQIPSQPLLVIYDLASRLMVPSEGSRMQAMTLRSVVLPDPDGPRRATTSPGATSRDTSLSASMRVSPSPKCLEIPRRLTRAAEETGLSMLSPQARWQGRP